MRAKIIIEMDNAAFDDGGELSRILTDLASKVSFTHFTDEYDRNLDLRDINGNKVGTFKVTGRRD